MDCYFSHIDCSKCYSDIVIHKIVYLDLNKNVVASKHLYKNYEKISYKIKLKYS